MARRLMLSVVLLIGTTGGSPVHAQCQFDGQGNITNPFDPSCGGVILTYTENPTGASDTIALGYPVPQPIDSLTPFDGFRSYASLQARHEDLALMNAEADSNVIGQTLSGRPIYAYRIGDSDGLTADGLTEPAAMINGGIHAREWQSPEAVTELFETLIEIKDDNGFGRYLIENVNVVIIPVLNIDGFLQTQLYPDQVTATSAQPREGRMRRKNLRNPQTLMPIDNDIATVGDNFWGVDLNRNSASGFGLNGGSSLLETSLVYRSAQGAGSEPEIDALENESTGAVSLAPANRLRLYTDVHSFSQIFFTPLTGNRRRDAITIDLMNRLRAVLGDKYRDGRDQVAGGGGIGLTSDYFAYTYQVPSWTLEIEPLNGAQDYGGTASHGHSGFILPDSEVARMRDEIAQMMLLGLYKQAGPPYAVAIQISEVPSGTVVYEARWMTMSASSRTLDVSANEALVPGSQYRLWLAFNKPMRWRDGTGAVTAYPGQGTTPVTGAAVLEIPDLNRTITLPIGSGTVWLDQPGGAPNGYLRYADDALVTTFTMPADLPASTPTAMVVSIINYDLSESQLDADPATPVDWLDGHWSGYEAEDGNTGDVGGVDCQFRPFVATAAGATPPSETPPCAAAAPVPPPPAPPPPSDGGAVEWLTLLVLLAAFRRRLTLTRLEIDWPQ